MLINIDYVKIDSNIILKSTNIDEFISFWQSAKQKIAKRVKHFESVFETANEESIFAELVFCLFTPQSKAISCWKAVNILHDKNLLTNGNVIEIAQNINNVRFQNNKSKYLIEARKKFTTNNSISIKKQISSFKNPIEARKWIIDNIKGIGYKEASHFLRNIGIGLDLAILDRHILKNLQHFKVIKEIPQTLTPKKYLDIEEKMNIFCRQVKIPMSHMDLLMWCMQTGGIFK